MLQPETQRNSEVHVYVSVPKAANNKRKTASLEILNVNLHNILESRCFIKGENFLLTATLGPPDWEVVVPGTPVIFVRMPGSHSILTGLLHYCDDISILPEWVR